MQHRHRRPKLADFRFERSEAGVRAVGHVSVDEGAGELEAVDGADLVGARLSLTDRGRRHADGVGELRLGHPRPLAEVAHPIGGPLIALAGAACGHKATLATFSGRYP